ncbi:MAG: hypothetical protein Q8L22_00825 [Reyranella sp.]|nr:hypothetical protein [Reyranella sp.]
MATQLGTPGVQGWAVYFNAAGINPVWTPLTSSGASLNNIPDQKGLKVYFILQSMSPGVTPVHNPSSPGTDPIQTESQITPTGTVSSAQTLNYRYDSFEVTFTPAAADAGNLTDINGFGIPMAVEVVYSGTSPTTSASRGYMIPGGGVGSSDTIWNELASAGGSGSIQYFAAGGGLGSGPRMAISPATALANNVGGTNYSSSNWNNYVTSLGSSSATSAGSFGSAGAQQIQIAGYFNGAPDANNVWHNAGFYSYRVTSSGGNFVLTPDASSQIQGAITITPTDLANSIYMTLGNATVSGLSTGNGTGGTTTLTMNTGANNEWGTVLRDFLAGFTAGYWGGTATSLNPNVSGSLVLNKEWNQDPTYAFGGAVTSGFGSVTPFGAVAYDEYAKVFFNATNSYGNGYSDFLTRAYNVGPLINVSDGSGSATDSNNITVTLFADNDTTSGYTPQVINNYLPAGSGGYLVPSGVNTNGIQTTLNFNVGTTSLKAGTPVAIVLKGATSAADVVLPTITSAGNYGIVSNGSGGYATSAYGSATAGVINIKDLPVTSATSGTGVNWYQIQVGSGGAQKIFNLYETVDSAGNILNPGYTGSGSVSSAISIDGLAAVTGTGAGQYVNSTSGMTISFFPGGTDTLDPSLLTTVSGTLTPAAPLVGLRPGYTSASGAPFHESYDAWSAGPLTTVYNGGLVFGWKGADNAALQQQTATSNYYVSAYTNKINGGDVARLVFSAASGSTLPTSGLSSSGTGSSTIYYTTATADSDGNWATGAPIQFGNGTYTVQMQEFLASDSTFHSALNSASVVQSFTVQQGAAVGSGQTVVVSGPLSNVSAGLTVGSGGTVLVSGGTASATMVNSGGSEFVISGNDTGAIVLGEHQVWAGATAVSMTIASGGTGRVYGTTSAAAVNGGGYQFVGMASSATASGTTINSGGNQWLLSGGVASSTTVLSGGNLIVNSGGIAMSATVMNGGWAIVDGVGANLGSGFYVTSTFSSGVNSGQHYSVHSVTGNATVSGGFITVYSGGTTEGAVLQGSGTWQYAWSGGQANSTTVKSGTYLDVYSGGSSLAATVQSGGWEYVWGSGSLASAATVQSAGYEDVYSGASAVSTTIQYGGWQLVWGAGTTASGTNIQSGGYMQVDNGGSAGGVIVSNGGWELVWTGGGVSGTTVSSGGIEYVWANASATNTVVSSGGTQDNFGSTMSTTIDVGGVGYAFSGGITMSAQVNSGGNLHVVSSGVAGGASVNNGGVEYVWGGGTDSASTIGSGGLQVLLQSGSLATGTILAAGGSSHVSSGGVASGTVVSSGGYLHVFNGGVESGAIVNAGGYDFIWSGGIVQGATMNGGFLEILSGGGANGGTIGFTSLGGIVKLDDSQHLGSSAIKISGLTPTAGAIDFADIGYTSGQTSAAWAQDTGSGTLTLTSGALQASVTLFGTYVASSFKLASDGTVGTMVTDPAAGNDSQNLIAQPHV